MERGIPFVTTFELGHWTPLHTRHYRNVKVAVCLGHRAKAEIHTVKSLPCAAHGEELTMATSHDGKKAISHVSILCRVFPPAHGKEPLCRVPDEKRMSNIFAHGNLVVSGSKMSL